MSRRAADPADSLDLLLDTICNMFGLFIFVAMLVALLAKVGGPVIVERARPAEVRTTTPAEDQSSAAVRRRIERLERAIAERGDADAESGVALAQEGIRRVETARRELAAREAMQRDLDRQLAGASDMKGLLDQLVPRLEAEVGRLDEDLRDAESMLEIELRTPRLRELAERIPVQIVLAGGRAYCVNDWSDLDAHPCEGWTTLNPQAVEPQRSQIIVHQCWRTGGQDIERTIRLRTDGGVLVGSLAELERDGRWRQVLSWLDPERHVASIKVAPDSFDAFGPVRASFAARGFFYDVAPVAIEDLVYRDRIIEGATRAQ